MPGWPRRKVAVPRYDTRTYAIGDDLIHPELSAAIADYLDKLAGEKLFGGPRKPLKPATIKSIRGNIHRYLSALHHAGHDISAMTTLEETVSFDLFKRAIEWLWERNGRKTSGPIGHIAWAIRCIAVKHLECDEATAEKFQSAMAELRVKQNGLSEKNRFTLQQFDDPKTVERVLGCSDALWEAAKRDTGKKAQLLAQSAVLIEILVHAPLRISNLRTLRLDRHLNRVDGRLYINIPAAESKNGQPLHYVLPPKVARRIDAYIDHWRCLFLPASNPYPLPVPGPEQPAEGRDEPAAPDRAASVRPNRCPPDAASVQTLRGQADPGLPSRVLRAGPQDPRPQEPRRSLRELLRDGAPIRVRLLR